MWFNIIGSINEADFEGRSEASRIDGLVENLIFFREVPHILALNNVVTCHDHSGSE